MKTKHLLFIALTTLALAAEAKTVRLLTVGNSFSANATKYLPDLVKAGGHELIHRPIVVGGASLELHATRAATNGTYTNGRTLQQELASDKWNYVTIQQASIKSHDIATYRPFAGQLRDHIKKHAPGATLLMHETWEYRCDDPRFAGKTFTQQMMYDGLTNAYRTVAAELGARLLPVGDAFHLADADPQWGYKPDTTFDPKKAKSPALPDQTHSLHSGWSWKSGKLGMDGHHANIAGQYLGACVWYEVLYGESVVGNKFAPPNLDPAYVRFLQETAHRAVTPR
jgi:hypothetical protein